MIYVTGLSKEFEMTEKTVEHNKRARGLWILAMVNVGIWAIAMIAMVFLIQKSPAAKGLYPILGGGIGVGIALISAIAKFQKKDE